MISTVLASNPDLVRTLFWGAVAVGALVAAGVLFLDERRTTSSTTTRESNSAAPPQKS